VVRVVTHVLQSVKVANFKVDIQRTPQIAGNQELCTKQSNAERKQYIYHNMRNKAYVLYQVYRVI
jgi:hypothetical protein